jgi:hypothetical protein
LVHPDRDDPSRAELVPQPITPAAVDRGRRAWSSARRLGGIAQGHYGACTAANHRAHAATWPPSTTSSSGSWGGRGRPGRARRCLGAGPRDVNSLNWKLRRFMAPKVRALLEATVDVGMRNAGMAEE